MMSSTLPKISRHTTQQFSYKIILIGDSGVGKTSIVSRLISNKFPTSYNLTIGVDYDTANITINDENNSPLSVKLQIWDTAGQENFNAITTAYYRGVIGAVIVFDVTDRATFKHVSKWIKQIDEYHEHRSDIITVLVGNKIDGLYREVDKSEAIDYASKNDLIYAETSARTGDHINYVFTKLAQEIYNLYPASRVNDKTKILGINVLQIDSVEFPAKKDTSKHTCCNIQ